MKKRNCMCYCLSGAMLLAWSSAKAQVHEPPTLQEEAAKNGDITIKQDIDYFGPQDLDDQARRSDLIVRGTIVGQSSKLVRHGKDIHTDYTMQILEVFKNPIGTKIAPAQQVIADGPGGVLTIDGHRVEIEVVNQPPVYHGGSSILFLHACAKGQDCTYSLTGGNISVVPFSEGKVFCDSNQRERYPLTAPYCGVTEDSFITTLKTRIAALAGGPSSN